MMWPSLKSSLDSNEWSHHRVWLRNKKVSILKPLNFRPYLLPRCTNTHCWIMTAPYAKALHIIRINPLKTIFQASLWISFQFLDKTLISQFVNSKEPDQRLLHCVDLIRGLLYEARWNGSTLFANVMNTLNYCSFHISLSMAFGDNFFVICPFELKLLGCLSTFFI